jgi:hypothetical protein
MPVHSQTLFESLLSQLSKGVYAGAFEMDLWGEVFFARATVA